MEQEKQHEKLKELVGQLRLQDIRLSSARLETEEPATPPEVPHVYLRSKAWHHPTERGFDCFHQYDLRIKDTRTNRSPVRLRVVFQVSYESHIPIDEAVFDEFTETSLRLTTWPYLREYVHSTFARMNWPVLIAPTFRTGLVNASKQEGSH
jgi:hypothetical protein